MASSAMTADTFSAMQEARLALVNAGFKSDHPAVSKLDAELGKHTGLARKAWLAEVDEFGAALRAKVKLAKDTESSYTEEQLHRDLANWQTMLDGLRKKFPA
jgi:hypothetical protein